jgi:hypothetical protein
MFSPALALRLTLLAHTKRRTLRVSFGTVTSALAGSSVRISYRRKHVGHFVRKHSEGETVRKHFAPSSVPVT